MPQMERREASIPIARDARASQSAELVRLAALHPPHFVRGRKGQAPLRRGDDGAPAPQTTGPAERWLDQMTADDRGQIVVKPDNIQRLKM